VRTLPAEVHRRRHGTRDVWGARESRRHLFHPGPRPRLRGARGPDRKEALLPRHAGREGVVLLDRRMQRGVQVPEQVQAYDLPPKALVATAKRTGARLTAATYGEPVVFWEYVRDAAAAANAAGLIPTVVSNGFIQEKALREVAPSLAAIKIDLKSFREEFYEEFRPSTTRSRRSAICRNGCGRRSAPMCRSTSPVFTPPIASLIYHRRRSPPSNGRGR